MKNFRFGILLSLTLLPLAVSCGGKSSHKHQDIAIAPLPAPSKYFVHGNPETLLAGTVGDASGVGDYSKPEDFNGYELVNYAEFSERIDNSKVDRITDQAELEDKNNTSKGPVDDGEVFHNKYAMTATDAGFTFEDARPEAKGWPKFKFLNRDGKFSLVAINDFPVESLHYSIKPEGEAFSILLKTTDAESGKTLSGIYFVKSKETRSKARIVTAKENYFIEGDGRAIGWKRDITINVCGKNAAQLKSEVALAMMSWSKAGSFAPDSIGHNHYSVEVLANAKPFTDLNQNCVNYIDSYKNEDQDDYVNMGVTLVTIDHFDSEIINSQVFIFNLATFRSGMPRISIVTHELGHALGLGHEFATETKEALPSIMGYVGVQAITEADMAAIKNLYPID